MSQPDYRPALLKAQALLEQGLALVREALSEDIPKPGPAGSCPDLNLLNGLIEIGDVAKTIRRTKETARRWTHRNGLAVYVGGRLYVSESRLKEFLARRPTT